MSNDLSLTGAIQTRYMLARAWHAKGRIDAAITGYREVLSLDPAHLNSALLLGTLMQGQFRLEEAVHIYRSALEYYPHEERLHKAFVTVGMAHNGPDAVFAEYGLARQDSRHLDPRPSEVLCCCVIRNELARLPYFLEYYRRKGVGSFLAVDNGSSDGSVEYLLMQPDVYLWQSTLSFNRANFGSAWFEPILSIYGRDRWCLIVDADELLYYPDCEQRTIASLCRRLDHQKKRAFKAIHLDMYSDLPIRDTYYASGQPFEEVCPYFDHKFYHDHFSDSGACFNQEAYAGGVRRRVFGQKVFNYLSKVPLVKYDADRILAGGQHWTNLPADQIAVETGCLLHFKFFSSFLDYAPQEAKRKEHADEALQYQEYQRGLLEQPALTLFHPAHSVKLQDSQQLVSLGVMRADEGPDIPAQVVFPRIEAPAATVRPLWSVMVSVYRRTQFLRPALESVLAQAAGPDEMQIEVVSDGVDDSTRANIDAIVRSIAGDRVFCCHQIDRAGHPEIFNICINRARGHWVHLLHDDDWVAPGFYQSLQRGICEAPEIGAAFCRHTVVGETGQTVRLSPLERETPGIIRDWLDRIAIWCRLQTPAIVVRREAYDRLGGYCPQAKSAFDWEMWQRIAVHYPVWFEPSPLAFFRLGNESESARLKASGEQIADSRAVIEIARGYLPIAVAGGLARRAGDYFAMWAIELAQKQVEVGNLEGALANLREGTQCSYSREVSQKLFAFLTGIQGSV